MKKLAGMLVVAMVLLIPGRVSAHVFLNDTTGTKGAVLHINPDDDPIAGQTASLFFDLQNSDIVGIGLTILDPTGVENEVTLNLSGTLATANFNFPTQGVYELKFVVQSLSSPATFKYSQRVSRGAAPGALGKPSYAWAEILLLVSSIGFILLGIIAFNRKAAIKLQSRWKV